MKKDEFEARFKQVLGVKPKLSIKSELALFANAENILAARREAISTREAIVRQADQARTRRLIALRQMASRLLDFFAIHPDTPAAATTLVALVLTLMTIQSRHAPGLNIHYSDLPDLPKTNDFSARYDAQLLAERQTYEREVEDAHKKTSGGI